VEEVSARALRTARKAPAPMITTKSMMRTILYFLKKFRIVFLRKYALL
jgi:hypothetical protein